MGHIDEGGLQPLVQLGDLGPRLHAQLGIQVRKRLVHEEDGRFTDNGPAQGHALSLTTRELLGLAVQQVLDAQNAAGFLHASLDLGLGRLAQLEAKGHVVIDRHVGIERIALEHHGDVSILGGHIVHHAVTDADDALGDLLQAGEHAQAGGFAAARGADKDEELFVLNENIQVLYGDYLAEPFPDMVVGNACHIDFSPYE